MSGNPVVLRGRAHLDIDEAVEHYLAEAGPAVTLDFVDAVEGTLRHISEQPTSGSPRYAHELDIPSLRFRPTGMFPYLVFYVERAAEVEVWRVLHGSRDIPACGSCTRPDLEDVTTARPSREVLARRESMCPSINQLVQLLPWG